MDKRPTHKSRHLGSFDYSTSAYHFVTFSTFKSRMVLGSVRALPSGADVLAEMRLNGNGACVERAIWFALSQFDQVDMDCYQIMPNHVHMVVAIRSADDPPAPAYRPLLSRFVGATRGKATRLIRQRRPGLKVWNQNYYDHVVRNEQDPSRIRAYIANNPSKWALDKLYKDEQESIKDNPTEWPLPEDRTLKHDRPPYKRLPRGQQPASTTLRIATSM